MSRSLSLRSLTILLISAALVAACGGGESPVNERRSPLAVTTSTEQSDDLYRFFVIAFAAAPGLTYMGQVLAAVEGGASVRQIVRTFTTKAQFTDLYPESMSDQAFAERLAENVVGDSALGSAKRQAVLDIVAALSMPGMTRGDVVYVIFKNLAAKSPQDADWGSTSRKMANQVAYARHYTEVMRGDTLDPDVLRRVVANVGPSSDTGPGMEALISTALAGETAFSSLPRQFPNLRAHFADMCADLRTSHNIQSIIPVDLNRDGRIDLVLSTWCSPRPDGGSFDGPTPARVLAFIQDAAGDFHDRTAEVFGQPKVDIGGVNEYHAVSDLNGDGYPDILLALQREDGRLINNPYNAQWTRNIALLSQGNGRYRVEPFGVPAWNFPIILRDNERGTQDVIATSTSIGVQAFTYDSGWKSITGYDWANSASGVFFPRSGPGQGSTRAIFSTYDTQIGVQSRTLVDGAWRQGTRFGYDVTVIQKQCCGNPGPTGAVMISIDGKDYMDASFGLSCAFQRTPTGRQEVLMHLNAQEILGGYRGQVVTYGETPILAIDRLMAFSFADDNVSLQNNPLTIRGDVPRPMEPNSMVCRDFNGDGLQDVLMNRSKREVTPVLYLNDGAGGLALVGSAPYPSQRATNGLMNYVMADLDGDGIVDFIYHPIATPSDSYAELRPLVHPGKRRLGARDLQK